MNSIAKKAKTVKTAGSKSNTTSISISTKEAVEVTTAKKSAVKSAAKPALIEGVEVAPTAPRKKASLGSIVFIAAGPGDPELLTVRAVRLIKSADKIVTDSQALHVALTYAHQDKVVSTLGEDEIELEPSPTRQN